MIDYERRSCTSRMSASAARGSVRVTGEGTPRNLQVVLPTQDGDLPVGLRALTFHVPARHAPMGGRCQRQWRSRRLRARVGEPSTSEKQHRRVERNSRVCTRRSDCRNGRAEAQSFCRRACRDPLSLVRIGIIVRKKWPNGPKRMLCRVPWWLSTACRSVGVDLVALFAGSEWRTHPSFATNTRSNT